MTRSNTDRITRLEKRFRFLRDALMREQFQALHVDSFSAQTVNELKRRLFDLERATRVPSNAQQPEQYPMTYSISLTAPDKESAIDAVYSKLNAIADADPVHRLDVRAAQQAASAIINALSDDGGCNVTVSMSGYITTTGRQGEPQAVTSVSTSINVAHASRPLKL